MGLSAAAVRKAGDRNDLKVLFIIDYPETQLRLLDMMLTVLMNPGVMHRDCGTDTAHGS